MIFAIGEAAPLSEHEVLVFLIQLSLLIGVARLLGGLVKRLGQPSVVGELLAGVLLGPSLFGRVAPRAFDWVFGEEVVTSVIFGLSWLGVIMLLVVIGFETDLAIISRFRTAALSVSAGALLTPLAVVSALAFAVPDSFIGEGFTTGVFAGFLALSLSVSALPVVAKILQELGYLRRNFGQITLAAGMTMDAVGWLLLAALSGIAQDGFDLVLLAQSFGGLVVFLALLLTVGRWGLDWLMRRVMAQGSSVTAALTISLVAALTGGVITQFLRLEAILGAFIVGILLATLRHQLPQVEQVLETTTAAIFAPIFFAFSGLRVDIGLLRSWTAIGWTIGLTAVAVIAKVIGTVIGGRLAGVRGREALALGSGLSALGAMGIVVAIVGLNLGVLSETGYTVIVLVAIVTSVLAPQLLKLVVRGWDVPEDERRRLDREELLAASEILGSKRVLIPTRGGDSSRYAAQLMASVLHEPEITVLAVDVRGGRFGRRTRGGSSNPSDVLGVLSGVKHRLIQKTAVDPADAIAKESRLGYDLIVIGASESESDSGVFSNVVDRVLASVDLPTVVVRFPAAAGEVPAELPRHVLVPVVATRASRAAEELAYSIARMSGGRASAIHVVNRPEGQGMMLEANPAVENAVKTGLEMVGAAAAFGERLGVVVETDVRVAPNAEGEIVDFANTRGVDLAIFGTASRPLSDRPFFGHRVSYMIENSQVPVMIIALSSRSE
ncbi:MAG: cation:proton antiporter [Acidimicrobiia bacterium]|nr:cation:proton antiporter [Acidimicrobiia bacterium]